MRHPYDFHDYPFPLRLTVPETFRDALSYEGQIHWLARLIDKCYQDHEVPKRTQLFTTQGRLTLEEARELKTGTILTLHVQTLAEDGELSNTLPVDGVNPGDVAIVYYDAEDGTPYWFVSQITDIYEPDRVRVAFFCLAASLLQDLSPIEADIETVNAKIAELVAQITTVENKIPDVEDIKADVQAAKEASEAAKQTAQEAKTTAEGIAATADKAAKDAEEAKRFVAGATATSIEAKTAAENAQTTANAAQQTANEAKAAVDNVDYTPRHKVACFGDSFGAQTGGWPAQLNMKLAVSGSSALNYCVSGAAWAYAENSIKSQIETAKNALGDEAAQITEVVIYAGRNEDISNPDADLYTWVKDTAVAARQAFPNARLIAGYNWGYGIGTDAYTWNDLFELNSVAGAWRLNDGEWLNCSHLWIKGADTSVQDDLKHPNATGSAVIASYILSAVQGSYNTRVEYRTIRLGSTADTSALITLNGSTVTLSWQGSVSDLKGEIKMPGWANPPLNVSGLAYIQSASAYIPVFANADGTITVYNRTAGANLGGTGLTMSWSV